MEYRPTNYEKETVIVFNEAEEVANIYTHNGRIIRKIDKCVEELPDLYKLLKSDEFSKTYEIPKKYVKISQPKKFTDEQLDAIRKRAKQNLNK